MWTDSRASSVHAQGHRVAAFGALGEPLEWWAYHRAHKRERMQNLGPEPLGPFNSLDDAKAAVEQTWKG